MENKGSFYAGLTFTSISYTDVFNSDGDDVENGFDTVFGSDIIYDENKVDVLFASVARLLKNCTKGQGTFVVAYRRRNVCIDNILEEADKAGFDVQDVEDRVAAVTAPKIVMPRVYDTGPGLFA